MPLSPLPLHFSLLSPLPSPLPHEGLPVVGPPPATTVAKLPTLRPPLFTLSWGRGRRRRTRRQSVRGLRVVPPPPATTVTELPTPRPPLPPLRRPSRNPEASARYQSDQGELPLFTLSKGRGEFWRLRQNEGEGSSAHPPRTTPIPQSRSPLHLLQGERQTPAYPPEFGEGSSAQPTTGNPKLSIQGNPCKTPLVIAGECAVPIRSAEPPIFTLS